MSMHHLLLLTMITFQDSYKGGICLIMSLNGQQNWRSTAGHRSLLKRERLLHRCSAARRAPRCSTVVYRPVCSAGGRWPVHLGLVSCFVAVTLSCAVCSHVDSYDSHRLKSGDNTALPWSVSSTYRYKNTDV